MCGFNQSELIFLIWIVVWCPIGFQFPFMEFLYKSRVQSDTKSILGNFYIFSFPITKKFIFVLNVVSKRTKVNLIKNVNIPSV